MICLAITITLNYTKVFDNISMLVCEWRWDEELICLYVGVNIFIIFLFYNFRHRPSYVRDPSASPPPRPLKYPKILGCLYTSPMCVSPLPRPPVPETWWNIGFLGYPKSFYTMFECAWWYLGNMVNGRALDGPRWTAAWELVNDGYAKLRLVVQWMLDLRMVLAWIFSLRHWSSLTWLVDSPHDAHLEEPLARRSHYFIWGVFCTMEEGFEL